MSYSLKSVFWEKETEVWARIMEDTLNIWAMDIGQVKLLVFEFYVHCDLSVQNYLVRLQQICIELNPYVLLST